MLLKNCSIWMACIYLTLKVCRKRERVYIIIIIGRLYIKSNHFNNKGFYIIIQYVTIIITIIVVITSPVMTYTIIK
jgi:hypothetical protein